MSDGFHRSEIVVLAIAIFFGFGCYHFIKLGDAQTDHNNRAICNNNDWRETALGLICIRPDGSFWIAKENK